MKVRTVLLGVISVAGNDVAAFQTANRINKNVAVGTGTTTALTAQQQAQSSRKDFLSSMLVVGIAVGTSTIMPLPAQAMDQYNDKTPTEFWTTGKPTTDKGKPNERTIKARSRDAENLWPNARTQNNVRLLRFVVFVRASGIITKDCSFHCGLLSVSFVSCFFFVSLALLIVVCFHHMHTYLHTYTVELCSH